MESVRMMLALYGDNLCEDAVAILVCKGGVKLGRISTSGLGDSAAQKELTVTAIAGPGPDQLEGLVANELLSDCSRAVVLAHHDSGSENLEALLQALTGRNIAVSRRDAETQSLRGLACWLLSGPREQQRLWHENPPPCDQLVSHSASWRKINERLVRRMQRHGSSAGAAVLPAIVAELGSDAIRMHRIDADLSATCLLTEPFLGYKNLMGLARLSLLPCHESTLDGLLESAANGNMAKLDLTIGDLLPAESVYGQYSLNAVVFSLGKLHDKKTLDELKPSRADVAASLTYTFIKMFFDTIVHTASAHGIPRVLVRGEFFHSETCRRRLFEAWNFVGVSQEALRLQFVREDCEDWLALTGGLLE